MRATIWVLKFDFSIKSTFTLNDSADHFNQFAFAKLLKMKYNVWGCDNRPWICGMDSVDGTYCTTTTAVAAAALIFIRNKNSGSNNPAAWEEYLAILPLFKCAFFPEGSITLIIEGSLIKTHYQDDQWTPLVYIIRRKAPDFMQDNERLKWESEGRKAGEF